MSEKIALVDDGRTAFAVGFLNEDLHLAWGSGDEDWDDPGEYPDGAPEPDSDDTELENELGRRVVTQASYVDPDEDGEIEFPDANFSISTSPTRRIYLRTSFLKTEEPAAVIREVGLFMGTQTLSEDDYLEPGDITDPGRMVILYRFAGITRSAARREVFEFVITV
jgi:hypothetical protein